MQSEPAAPSFIHNIGQSTKPAQYLRLGSTDIQHEEHKG